MKLLFIISAYASIFYVGCSTQNCPKTYNESFDVDPVSETTPQITKEFVGKFGLVYCVMPPYKTIDYKDSLFITQNIFGYKQMHSFSVQLQENECMIVLDCLSKASFTYLKDVSGSPPFEEFELVIFVDGREHILYFGVNGSLLNHILPDENELILTKTIANVIDRINTQKNHEVINKKRPLFLGKHDKDYITIGGVFAEQLYDNEIDTINSCLNGAKIYSYPSSSNQSANMSKHWFSLDVFVDNNGNPFSFSDNGELLYDYGLSFENKVVLQNIITNAIIRLNVKQNAESLVNDGG